MKRMRKLNFIHQPFFALVFVLILVGCQDVLEENPKGTLTPEFFATGQGLEGGVTAAYSYLRYYYGTEGGHNLTVYGTDEFTNGNQTSNPPLNVYSGITSDNGDLLTPWNRAYPAINTCNGVIELGAGATDLLEEAKTNIIAEAKYLRAHWYFLLVKTFGGVTLDLGSGPLRFNQTPSSEFKRASLAETYDAIITDLEEASVELPNSPRDPGRAWKATALHLLAKVYLTRAWSEAAQSADYDSALAKVNKLIPSPSSPVGNYNAALLSDFADVFAEGNEYNSEVLLTANRIGNVDFNVIDTNTGQNDANLQQNRSNFYFRMFYTDFPGMIRDVENGRPWIRFKPTDYLLNLAFSDKTVDSRFDKSFQTVWYANDETEFDPDNPTDDPYPRWSQAEADQGYVDPSLVGQRKFDLGDTAVWFVPDHITLTQDEIAQKGYTVLLPSYTSGQKGHFPSMSKYNAVERPVPGTEDDPNVASYRSYIIYRFAETYLVGAEAALMKGNTALAADYINTLRRRAAWPGMENDNEIVAGDVTIDFILDERTRELAGEQTRWFDLVRTGKLEERVKLHNPDGSPNVQSYHRLRPIPQDQIDRTVGDYGQNPGYN